MKDDLFRILEFDRILEAISGFSCSNAAERLILELRPLRKRSDLDNRFGLIREIRQMYENGELLRLSAFEDIAPYIERLKPADSILEARELYSFVTVLRIISGISEQVNPNNNLPLLKTIADGMNGFPEILKSLVRSVNSEGNILDSASPLLSRLRAEIRTAEKNIRKKLEERMSDRHVTPFLQDSFITQRAGRWVIPVRMDSKGLIHGVVHDVSRSGETAFIEPLEIIGPANGLENLMADARAEEIRILKSLCRDIRSVSDKLSEQYEKVVHFDLLNSITMFAVRLRAEIPAISTSLFMKLSGARHPLLELMRMNGAMGNVMPLDLELGRENKVMVITGPNAGGKTIAIKTVGLLHLMALCGIPVTADSSSVFPFVSRILVDIGDEQSIDESLSTFSAHVSKISQILGAGTSDAVVLLDELGTGTEPLQGSAIACAVLRELHKSGGLVLATTHLMEIAGFVERTEGMLNASMEYDADRLTPLYRLRPGEPGQAHAIETAKRFGLPEDIISSAKNFLGSMNIELYDLITDLRVKRDWYENMLREIEETKKELENKGRALEERLSGIESDEKKVLAKAYKEAGEIIRNAKQQMQALINESKKKGKEALKRAEEIHSEVIKKIMGFDEASSVSLDALNPGDSVFARSINCDAIVVEIDKKYRRLRIRARGRDIQIPASDIAFKKAAEATVPLPEAVTLIRDEEVYVSGRIDLIGLRVDEAISRLEPFLNHAALAGLNELIIIHGVGSGALLKSVHEHLSGHPLIKEFRSGIQGEGGRGVTFIKLK